MQQKQQQQLVIDLYCTGKKKAWEVVDLNSLRVRLAKGRVTFVATLPSSEAAFLYHVKRAAWQTRVWMSAGESGLRANLDLPVGNGWNREGGAVVPVFFDGPTSCEVLSTFVCNCKGRSKCLSECSCRRSDLPCTELCSCEGNEKCGNPITRRQEPEDQMVDRHNEVSYSKKLI